MSSIQIAEYDLSTSNLLKLFLEGFGYEIIETSINGQMAIEQFKLLIKPDVVLMDYRIPIKDGIESSIEILDIYRKTKIIIITADEQIKKHALEIGVIEVVVKPFDSNELLISIENIIKKYTINQNNIRKFDLN